MKIFLIVAIILGTVVTHAGGSIVSGGFDDLGIQIKFYSPGNGIDKITEKMLLAISSQGLKDGVIAMITSTPEGSEGDIIYCVEFRNSQVRDNLFQAFDDLVLEGKNVSAQTVPYCGSN